MNKREHEDPYDRAVREAKAKIESFNIDDLAVEDIANDSGEAEAAPPLPVDTEPLPACDFIAYSPVTGERYEMICAGRFPAHFIDGETLISTRCFGGTNAEVVIW